MYIHCVFIQYFCYFLIYLPVCLFIYLFINLIVFGVLWTSLRYSFIGFFFSNCMIVFALFWFLFGLVILALVLNNFGFGWFVFVSVFLFSFVFVVGGGGYFSFLLFFVCFRINCLFVYIFSGMMMVSLLDILF